MTNTLDARDFQSRLERLDALLGDMERYADPPLQKRLRELVQVLLDVHGAGLERLLEHLADAGETGRAVLDACARDDVVSGLLLLHGLHPLDLESRVQQALDDVRPALQAHGGDVELLGVRDGVVRLRADGSCPSCASSARAMQQTLEEAICGKAPEITSVVVVGLPEEALVENDGPRFALPMV